MTNANDFYGSPMGSDNYYKHSVLFPQNHTDGVRDMIEFCKAYWLLDLICSHQSDKKVREQEFQVWKLHREDDHTAVVVCEDGNDNVVTSQEIPYTDFPYTDATIWLTNGVMLLPTEY